MKAFNKIGFHTSIGGNPSGIGEHLRTLDQANIPFFIKAADSMTGLFDAQQLIYARGNNDIGHTLVFRRSIPGAHGQPPSGAADVPDYTKEPEAAAADHWQWHRDNLPSELDPKLVWIETINELRKEVSESDWIGKFAFFTGQMAMADGFKFSAFGYSTGTPDEGAWETDGMLQYLELCQQHPNQLSVALHEYSLKVDNIWFLRNDHVGRFQKLFATCDKHHIKRPKVLMTEWGWTHERVPVPEVAIAHIREVGELYAQYPEILGGAIWYLGPKFGGIANLAQKLIQPVTEFTLQHRFDVPDVVETIPPPRPPVTIVQPPTTMTAGSVTANGRFIRDVTIPDDMPITAGDTFTKTWGVENNGRAPWDAGYKLIHVGGTKMHTVTSVPLPATASGAQTNISVDMIAPATPGTYFSDWRFQDDKGQFFGDIMYVRILSEAAPAPTTGISDGKFVADLTIPDDTNIEPGQTFTKSWRVRNNGTRPWGAGFKLEFVGGTNMAQQISVPLPATAPGAQADISIKMTAPAAPGMHFSDYRMKDENGNPFGEIIYVRIQVPSPAGVSLATPLSQRDPQWASELLGHPGSPKTIGEWGCMMTCFTMVATTYGRSTNPSQFNHAMITNGGYLNGYLTKWNALSNVYKDIVYMGKVDGGAPDMINRINASLAAGNPVTILVDFTRDTPYSDNDQHWVLIVGRDGDDYRINDPWLLPAQEASLRDRYGRTGKPLRDAIRSAIFYRSTKPVTPPTQPPSTPISQLERGMNINPDAPNSNPMDNDDLKGLEWVRFVFKLAARDNPTERDDIQKAFAQYDTIVRKYNAMGVNSLIVLNQETVWGRAPWAGNNDWSGYGDDLAAVASQIAKRYRRYGEKVAYEIWNEGDLPNNPASVFVPPAQFATVLKKVAAAIRAESPQSPLVFGGLATGPQQGIDYLKACKQALNGPWPVDAIGVHPYGRYATKAPFDWGSHFGTLGEAFEMYRNQIPDIPFWITEIGVAADSEIGPANYPQIGDYIKDVYKHVEQRYTDLVPVIIWFAWSDWMRNAGIVRHDGQRKDHVYAAFRAMRNREL
ncbi:MAG: C39 family peptidase [Ardenticatenaceae bacterium]|nr:C39 family peptidase [Anaerolineales bacterium]MCB8922014.1 C39 family peptidase [Ardenticatenaceae bacterium]MCB8989590.1 C39 family peptidase [Ardenticatenaceae bacterium]MCB9003133.1 C39 family peptidase [Ardenticatenaceae bacterium]